MVHRKEGRTRLLAEVDERRNLRTNAAVGQLLDRHLEMAGPEHAWRPNNRLDCNAVTMSQRAMLSCSRSRQLHLAVGGPAAMLS
jgi:hypothetical protein